MKEPNYIHYSKEKAGESNTADANYENVEPSHVVRNCTSCLNCACVHETTFIPDESITPKNH